MVDFIEFFKGPLEVHMRYMERKFMSSTDREKAGNFRLVA